jgi:hypothetical protein
MIDTINRWAGECIIHCGRELTDFEIYGIMLISLPFVLFFLTKD